MSMKQINIDYYNPLLNNNNSGIGTPKKVNKNWGYELHYINTDLYCMKLLSINIGCKTSNHFHLKKHETLLVTKGILKITTINKDQIGKVFILQTGNYFIIAPGFTHTLENIGEDTLELIEASSYSEDTDSIRLLTIG